MVIGHISDLHVGEVYFSPHLLEQTIQELNELKPHVVVVGGDLTEMGLQTEYEKVKEYLDSLKCEQLIIVPGNHDSRNVGYIHFEKIFGARDHVLNYQGVSFVCADSSIPDLDEGRIGREHYEWIRKSFRKPASYRIFVLHHHLISVPGTGRERHIVHDAGDVLEILASLKVNMVLSGHKHVPYLWHFENMLIVNAGATSSLRLRGATRPCYNIIEIEKGKARVFRKYPGGGKELIG